jgi:hypothetical protein
MTRVCTDYQRGYDDARQTTICPHEAFLTKSEAQRKDAAMSLIGKPVRFRHRPDDAPTTIECVDHVGFIQLRGSDDKISPFELEAA